MILKREGLLKDDWGLAHSSRERYRIAVTIKALKLHDFLDLHVGEDLNETERSDETLGWRPRRFYH